MIETDFVVINAEGDCLRCESDWHQVHILEYNVKVLQRSYDNLEKKMAAMASIVKAMGDKDD